MRCRADPSRWLIKIAATALTPFGDWLQKKPQCEIETRRTCWFPSGLPRSRGSNTTPSADFRSAPRGTRTLAPPFDQALLAGTPIGSPWIRDPRPKAKNNAYCSCPSSTSIYTPYLPIRFRVQMHAHLVRRPNVISVRSLTGLGVRLTTITCFEPCSCKQAFASLTTHSQTSSPRIVTSPQLPSPRVYFLQDFHLVY